MKKKLTARKKAPPNALCSYWTVRLELTCNEISGFLPFSIITHR